MERKEKIKRIKKILLLSNDIQKIYTPLELCEEMINKIDIYRNQKILVMFNIEFLEILRNKLNKENLENVWFMTCCELKKKVAISIGLDEKHIIYEKDRRNFFNLKLYNNKNIMPKFDVVIGNPPYNEGLLDKTDLTLPHKNIINRIDTAFIILGNECLKENGKMIIVWPWVWMQLKSWEKVRKWISEYSGIKQIIYNKYNFENVAVGTIITYHQKNYKGIVEYVLPEETIVLDKIDENIIPVFRSKLSKNIFEKVIKYPHKLNLKKLQECKNKNCLKVLVSGGNGAAAGINNGIIKYKIFSDLILSKNGENDKNRYNVIEINNEQEFEILNNWWNSKLFNFIGSHIKIDWHNTKYNVNLMPNILYDIKDKYNDVEVYKLFNLNEEEINYIETQVNFN